MLHFHGSHLGLVIKTGLVTGIISLTVSFRHPYITPRKVFVEMSERCYLFAIG